MGLCCGMKKSEQRQGYKIRNFNQFKKFTTNETPLEGKFVIRDWVLIWIYTFFT